MTKRVFTFAAQQVAAILVGQWTHEPPAWATGEYDACTYNPGPRTDTSVDYTRAVQTAEAFILLFKAFNPLFDETRFLQACGLVDAPVKAKRR